MTLREQFDNLVPIEFGGMQEPLLTDVERIADEYAIEFLDWYMKIMFIMGSKYIGKKPKELLKIFKKEKGL